MADINCSTSSRNIVKQNCVKDAGQPHSVWLDVDNDGVATETTALLEATWTTKINATVGDRMIILRDADEVEWTSDDATVKETNTQKTIKTAAGKRTLKMSWYSLTTGMVEAFQALDQQNRYMYLITKKKHIIAGSADGTKVTPVECKLNIDNVKPASASEDLWTLEVNISVLDPDSLYKKMLSPNEQTTGAWDPTAKDGIVDVELTEVSAAAGSIVVDVNGKYDGREVSTLVTAGDWAYTGGAIMSVANVGNRYTFTPTTTFATGVLSLDNQPSMTVKGVECQTADQLAITI
jgi:hypothetical protein